MRLNHVTPVVLTFNEAPNIARTLDALSWAEGVVVIDSGSTDGTIEIARTRENVRLIHRPFDNHTEQWNFGLDQVATDWVLSLDADYLVPRDLPDEILDLPEEPQVAAYYCSFQYSVFERVLWSSLYPSRAVLFRKSLCRYVPEGHTQTLKIDGSADRLRARILHDDRKPIDGWFAEQLRYSRLEAEHLLATPSSKLNSADRLRRLIFFAPLITPLYILLRKGLILDGLPGLFYTLQRTLFELLLSLRLLDSKLRAPQ